MVPFFVVVLQSHSEQVWDCTCVLRIFFNAEAITASSISKWSRKTFPVIDRDIMKIVDCLCGLNFFDPEHSDLRICCFLTNLSSGVSLPALKFHGIRKFSKMQFPRFRILGSKQLHTVGFSIPLLLLEVRCLSRCIPRVSCHSIILFCSIHSIRSQYLRGRCQILWIVEDCRR